jgi:hypothetical protein
LYAVGPDGFENCFIEDTFVGSGQFWLTSEQPMHFVEGEAELFPLSENVFVPGKSSVKVQTEIFDIIFLGSCTSLIWTGGQVALRVVKVTFVDLASLAFILHFYASFELQVGPFVGSAWQRLNRSPW